MVCESPDSVSDIVAELQYLVGAVVLDDKLFEYVRVFGFLLFILSCKHPYPKQLSAKPAQTPYPSCPRQH